MVTRLALLSLMFATALTAQTPRPAVECEVRGGLPNVLAKLKAAEGGTEIRVAYLGGSITAAPGWRVKSLKWLQDRYPKAKLVEINAAIGGTGSNLGVFRNRQDVLAHKPDLLFVEFAVNDGGASPENIHRGMEGIVRQTWEANPATDICFVYTISEPVLPELKAGHCSRSATAMEVLADHYRIPSIHFGLQVKKMLESGELIFKGERTPENSKNAEARPLLFSTDGVHPLVETGHELYLQTLARSWEALEGKNPAPKPHTLDKPLREDHWAAAKLVPITPAMQEGPWTKLNPAEGMAQRFSKQMPDMWLASQPGAALKFKFNGTVAGVYDLVGPDGGQLSVTVDGKEAAKLTPRFDPYCTYHRISTAYVFNRTEAADGNTPAPHEVRIVLSPEAFDKKAILFPHNREDYDKNPAKYAARQWHAGSLMLIGDLVE